MRASNSLKNFKGIICHFTWFLNRSHRTGYKIVRIYTPKGKATGEYEDFVRGFVADDTNVWDVPVGITVANDGSLVFTTRFEQHLARDLRGQQAVPRRIPSEDSLQQAYPEFGDSVDKQ